MNGDLENEGEEKAIQWAKAAAKQYLKKCFREKIISVDFGDHEQVWHQHCKHHSAFRRMKFDNTFKRQLDSIRVDYIKKAARCASDLKAYNAAKKNHPTPLLNHRGEPQWHGSQAQKLLKDMVANNQHVGKAPKSLYKEEKEFQVYCLQTFCDHIYQEERLLKFRRYLDSLQQAKIDALQY